MEAEFINMVNTHRGIIYKVCHVYGAEKDYKEDLFQEIVLQLWKSFPNYRKESSAATWMYRVALNTAISHFRKESKKPHKRRISTAELEIPDMGSFSDDNEKIRILDHGIRQLTRIEKAFVMLYLEDKSYREISEIMGVSRSLVGVKLNRIKIKLEKIIKVGMYEFE